MRPARRPTIASQDAVDVIMSFFSLGWNNSLLGLKCDPVFPGLLLNCIPNMNPQSRNLAPAPRYKAKTSNSHDIDKHALSLTKYNGNASKGNGMVNRNFLVIKSRLLYSLSGSCKLSQFEKPSSTIHRHQNSHEEKATGNLPDARTRHSRRGRGSDGASCG